MSLEGSYGGTALDHCKGRGEGIQAPCTCSLSPTQTESLVVIQRHFPVECRTFAPNRIGSFDIDRIINPAAVRLHLHKSLRIHPTLSLCHS